ncbi:MAG: GNAT family N-acetyltransferase [Candidatus Nitrosocaldaceae archaeon]
MQDRLDVKYVKEPIRYIFSISDNGNIKSVVELIIIYDIFGGRPSAYIHKVYTAEKYQRQGFATKLLNDAINKAKEMNCYKVFLVCDDKLVDFYERLGFFIDQHSMRYNVEVNNY